MKNKLTDLCGDRLLQNDVINTFCERKAVGETQTLHSKPASERRGNDFKGFIDFYLKAKGRILPRLSCFLPSLLERGQSTRWATSLSPKVNFPGEINFKAICGIDEVTLPSRIGGTETIVAHRVATRKQVGGERVLD
jgi:hypothetical protein